MQMMKIFVGYDEREVVAYHTLCHSIISRASKPVCFIPLSKSLLATIFSPNNDKLASTEFSLSRFLVPYLSHYQGNALYMDSDIIVTRDIQELFDMYDPSKAVQVVKHDYRPNTSHKFLGQRQTTYEKKNWSSVMLFNNQKCRSLTPRIIGEQPPLYLHQFQWLDDESLVGELPETWNFLVNEYPKPATPPAAIHYTLGGPFFKEYCNTDYANVWMKEFESLSTPFSSR